MNRMLSLFVFLIGINALVLFGCSESKTTDKKIEVSDPKKIDVSDPKKILHSFVGTSHEIFESTLVNYDNNKISVFDLVDGKLIGTITPKSKYGISGLDIYKDTVTWSEANPQSVKDNIKNPLKVDSNIFTYNIKTKKQTQITSDTNAQISPKIYGDYLIWQDNRDDNKKTHPGKWSLMLYNLKTGKEKIITPTLATYATYNINNNNIVWEDHRKFEGPEYLRGGENVPENNKDIYMYDIKNNAEIAIATGPYMECKPDISEDYIVWEDRNNNSNNADIVLFKLSDNETTYLTKDKFAQATPRIYDDYIVWMDERNGTSSNDVIIGGVSPNSDIVLFDIKTKTELIITGDGPQISPNISSKWISYVLSSQVNSKIQVVKYK